MAVICLGGAGAVPLWLWAALAWGSTLDLVLSYYLEEEHGGDLYSI